VVGVSCLESQVQVRLRPIYSKKKEKEKEKKKKKKKKEHRLDTHSLTHTHTLNVFVNRSLRLVTNTRAHTQSLSRILSMGFEYIDHITWKICFMQNMCYAIQVEDPNRSV